MRRSSIVSCHITFSSYSKVEPLCTRNDDSKDTRESSFNKTSFHQNGKVEAEAANSDEQSNEAPCYKDRSPRKERSRSISPLSRQAPKKNYISDSGRYWRGRYASMHAIILYRKQGCTQPDVTTEIDIL